MALSAEQRSMLVRADLARRMLVNLGRSPDWVKRFAANDPTARDQYMQLTEAQALGANIAHDEVFGAEIKADKAALAATSARFDELKANKAFIGELSAGKQSAIDTWRQAVAEQAVASGISPNFVQEAMSPPPKPVSADNAPVNYGNVDITVHPGGGVTAVSRGGI